MRFPPFEVLSHNPKEMELADVCWPTRDSDTILNLGNENGWFIHRSIKDEKPKFAREVFPISGDYDTKSLLASREGWALSPHPLHSFARKWIPFGVMILIVAIILHVLEPVLLRWNLMSEAWAGSINLGLLDYPILFVMASPFIIIPLFFRIIANVEDIRRQHRFKNNPPKSPNIQLQPINSTGPIRFTFKIPKGLEGRGVRGFVRVGLLPPHRDALMDALVEGGGGRPPVGLSTPLPKGWMPVADDGSGIGETTPMVVGKGPARLFQEPMRIHESCEPKVIDESEIIELEAPKGPWPGTEYGPFVNVNWELILEFNGKNSRPLFWIERLDVKSSSVSHKIEELIAITGRLESS
tara:strand:- start:405 stop:1466 length:1062 start_codon:yes stop_codon:yes gene_type:complete